MAPDGSTRFTQAQCDALFSAILINDEIDLAATLPEAIRFDYDQTSLDRYFDLCRLIWRTHIDRQECIEIATILARDRQMSDADQLRFKHIRARFKHLRFAFAAFGENHRYPPFFDLMTSVMGNLQDAFKNEKFGAVRTNARIFRLLLTSPMFALLVSETSRFEASTTKGFADYMKKQAQPIRAFLAQPSVTAKEFHDTRKIISRYRACFATISVLTPSPVHDQIAIYLATINGMMGGFHDGLMAGKLNGTLDYHKDRFTLQPQIAVRLGALADAVLA